MQTVRSPYVVNTLIAALPHPGKTTLEGFMKKFILAALAPCALSVGSA
jgi:hypothetical protein